MHLFRIKTTLQKRAQWSEELMESEREREGGVMVRVAGTRKRTEMHLAQWKCVELT